ncbi:arginine ABC transporter ATP-binding protein [Hypericibacter terrae]|uniref:Arginine ABC transporter ATP-binding protein n=1 Tax=Hypericibacter terrae TaxID=2602015 RepID=A0A5J6MPX2_9PROT|nr:amino acid ABC transporter ATP-binding protein [Hypericibacter terrae]QEX19389.1 arginine ABC transporter ATP-binding protein [Hypericibacter terrae]
MTDAFHSPAIELRGLRLAFSANPILSGIDLSVAAGERLALIGPSGSGKSTLLRCVNGLERPDEGEVFIFGEPLARQGRSRVQARRRMGMIFQHFNLYSMKTVLENVTLAPIAVGGLKKTEAERIARTCLGRVDVSTLADKYPFQISGGQQQRVAIARALAMQPEILLLDEPTSALDPELVQSMLELIQSLAGDGMTILCVTHEINFARRLADRILFMAEGRILESGRPDELLDRPRSERLKSFLATLGSSRAQAEAITG